MKDFYYKYNPQKGPRGHSVRFYISKRWIETAKNLPDNVPSLLEKIAREVCELYYPDWIKNNPERTICGWNEDYPTFLHHLEIPGNASGIAFEEGINGPAYLPHNMDYAEQASIVFAIMGRYDDFVRSSLKRNKSKSL